MKELVEKINALYAEFEKDATAQADKESCRSESKKSFTRFGEGT